MYTICANIVKLQSKVQTSVLGLGVDFILPLSQQQQQEEQQEEQEPHQNIPEGNILEVLNFAKSLTKPNQTHATPLSTLTLPPPLNITNTLPLQQKFRTQNFFHSQNLL